MLFSVALFQFVRYLLYKTIAVDGVLDWAWAKDTIHEQLDRLKNARLQREDDARRREQIREELRLEMERAAAVPMQADENL